MLTTIIEREQDLELIHGQLLPDAELPPADPDATVCEAENPHNAELPDRLLRAVPFARVLTLADKADQAFLYELWPVRRARYWMCLIGAIRLGLDHGTVDGAATTPTC